MLRPAKQSDVLAIFPLISIIWKDMSFPLLDKLDANTFKETMFESMQQTDSKFSYRNAWVYEENNKIIAILYGYLGSKEVAFNQQFQNFIQQKFPDFPFNFSKLERETNDNEWYLDSIVVSKNHRGKGIAKQFFNHLYIISQNAKTIGLNCEIINTKALSLYKKLGFKETSTISFLNHSYYHLQKNNLNNSLK